MADTMPYRVTAETIYVGLTTDWPSCSYETEAGWCGHRASRAEVAVTGPQVRYLWRCPLHDDSAAHSVPLRRDDGGGIGARPSGGITVRPPRILTPAACGATTAAVRSTRWTARTSVPGVNVWRRPL